MVPHLITALTGPINELEQRMLESMPAIERWFRLEWMEHTPPFYTSVDLRNAGFKLAPVDTNLYPGGWNNLTPEMLPLAVQAAMAASKKISPKPQNLLQIPSPPTPTTSPLTTALAPVDPNLHPGGWNNPPPEMLPPGVQAAMAAIEKICPEAKNLLLIPERHTRNSFYLTNVARLVEIFSAAGLNVRLGSLDEAIT